MENAIQISKNLIQPIIKSNIQYVDSIEEFEKINLDYNQTVLCFDNFKPCFYVRERNRHGEYSNVKFSFTKTLPQRCKRKMIKRFTINARL
jgi:hypothetical protein